MTVYDLTPLQGLKKLITPHGTTHYLNTDTEVLFNVEFTDIWNKGWYEFVIPLKCLKGSVRNPEFYFFLEQQDNNEEYAISLEQENNKITAIIAFPTQLQKLQLKLNAFQSEFLIGPVKARKLSQGKAALKLFSILKRKKKKETLRFLLNRYKEDGISGVRQELRDAGYASSNSEIGNLNYEEWLATQIHQSEIEYDKWNASSFGMAYQPLISIILPTYNTPLEWLKDCIDSVKKQTYTNWELCIADDASTNVKLVEYLSTLAVQEKRIKLLIRKQNGNISACSNSAVELATGEWVTFLDHDDLLTPNALFEIVYALQDQTEVDVVYTDQDKINTQGICYQPFFKPDWSPVFFKGVMYVGHLLAVKRSVGQRVGWFNSEFDTIQDYEFMLRVSERTDKIIHVPKVLYHWRESEKSIAGNANAKGNVEILQELAVNNHLKRMKIDGYVQKNKFPHRLSLYPLKMDDLPKVSIIIPTKNRAYLLEQCIDSILQKTQYRNYEIVLIDTGSDEPDAIELVAGYRKHPKINVLDYKGKFNFSKVNNVGANNATGAYLVFLNNDTEVITGEWLENFLFYMSLPNVGAVGPLLLFPNNKVQHAGVVLGFRGTADHVMRDYSPNDDGYFGSLSCSREVSALTAACVMIKKDVFAKVNAFEENYNNIYQDVDLCLKIKEQGLVCVYTPTVRLYHYESASRGHDYDFMDRMLLKDRWEEELLNDAYYNPNFRLDTYSLQHTGYEPKFL